MPEFALVAPIFLLIIFGIFDFGHGIYDYISLQTAANEAARVVIQGEPDLAAGPPYSPPASICAPGSRTACASDAAAKDVAGIALVPSPSCPNGPIPSVSILQSSIPANTGWIFVTDSEPNPQLWNGDGSTCSNFAPDGNSPVQVTIVYPFRPVTPVIGRFLPGGSLLFTIFSVYRTEY